MLKATLAFLFLNFALSACAVCSDDPGALKQVNAANSGVPALGTVMRSPELKGASEQERVALLNYSILFGALVLVVGAGLFVWHRRSSTVQIKNRRVSPRPVEETTNTRAAAVAEYFRKKSETVERVSE